LSQDIQKEFAGIMGFSPQNLWYMRAFYKAWTEAIFNLQQPVGDLESFFSDQTGRSRPEVRSYETSFI